MNPFEASHARIFSPKEVKGLMAGLTPEQKQKMEELKQSIMEEQPPATQRMPQGAMEKNIEEDAQEELRIRERLAQIDDPAERERSPFWSAEESAVARNAALAAVKSRKGSTFIK